MSTESYEAPAEDTAEVGGEGQTDPADVGDGTDGENTSFGSVVAEGGAAGETDSDAGEATAAADIAAEDAAHDTESA